MSRPPTGKQLKFANSIAAQLGIRMPKEKTRQSLFLFIREHRPQFEKERKEFCDNYDCEDELVDPEEDRYMFWAMGGDPMTGCLGDD